MTYRDNLPTQFAMRELRDDDIPTVMVPYIPAEEAADPVYWVSDVKAFALIGACCLPWLALCVAVVFRVMA